MAAETAALDTLYLVETPEGVDLQARVAGPIPRCLAYSIDLSLRALIFLIVSLLLTFAGDAGQGILLLLFFLLEWFYPVLFEVYRRGQTPGKKYLGLMVVNADLTPVGWSGALARNLLRAADFLPFAYLFGLTSMVLSKRFQRLGDLAAGTLVIYREEQSLAQPLPDCPPQMPKAALQLEDHLAIINFTQRHQQLSAQRQQELADLLGDFAAEQPGERVHGLRRMGNWLLGGR